MNKLNINLIFLLSLFLFWPSAKVLAMPVGTLLYRTSGGDKMYGYNSKDLIVAEHGKLTHIYSGHVAIYVGQENGVDYIVEMQPKGAIKVPAKYFINESLGEKLIGAKIPENASPLQIAKAVEIAKNLANKNLAYDFDFKYQKGPQSGDWICSGLTEKVYESANISNPTNLNSLEYDPNYYAVDITPDGYDDENIYNPSGDCFATNLEFSKITPKKNMLIPAPELLGYDVGLERNGNRYIFLPYTQYLQSDLKDIKVDISLSSSFPEPTVRGDSPILGLVLKWSLINNPISTVKNIASKISSSLIALKDKVFPDGGVALADNSSTSDLGFSSASSAELMKSKTISTKTSTAKATSTKTSSKTVATKKTTPAKITVTKATSTKAIVSKVTANKTATSTKTISIPKTTKTVKAVSAPKVSSPKTTTTVKASPEPVVKTTPIITSSPKATTAAPASATVVITKPLPTSTTTEIITTKPTTTPIESTPTTTPEIPVALIAKIYSNGSDDWLEIVNTADYDFDLAAANYRLEKAKTANDPTLIMRFGNDSDGVYPGGTIISARGSYLIASVNASSDIKAKADAIATKDTFSWTDDSYTLYLGTDSISSDTDSDIIDKVGYGDTQYYLGTAPAPALKKGYALERKASATSTMELLASGGLQELWPRLFNSKDNSKDFILVPYDKALIDSENSSSSTEAIGDSNLFVNPAGLNSEGLTQLWHFDECYNNKAANELQASGEDPIDLNVSKNWLPGKWGCATNLSHLATTSKMFFGNPLDVNQFSLNYYYRNTGGPGVFLHFYNKNSSEREAYLELSPYFTNIYGFPGPEGRLNNVLWPDDYTWHQVTVVINRNDGYFALYLDGKENYKYEYNGIMPTFSYLDFGNNQDGPLAIDELSIWDRALPATEIRTINLLNQPFNPYNWPTPQKVAKLEHYWSFDENNGLVAKNSVASDNMSIKLDQWDMEGRNDSALKIGETVNMLLDDLPVTDLSLSFWWRNSSIPNEGRPHIMLKSSNDNIMSLTPTIYNASFGFNDYGETFTTYGQSIMPNDNKWHHLALTYDSYRMLLSLYIDGEKKMEKNLIKLKPGEKIDGLELVQENWTSSIDELKVWSGTLTPAEVSAEYKVFK